MRKFTKVLALVIAIAILACPFASAAGTAVNGGYADNAINLSVPSDDAIRVTFQSEGFITSIIKLDVTGIALADDEAVVVGYEVIGATAENLEPTVELALSNGEITALIDGPGVTEYASVVFDIPVVAESAFTAEITNVKAGTGTGANEYYVDLGFTNSDGSIDAEAAEDAGLILEVTEDDIPVAHEHDFTGAWQSDATNHWKVCSADDEIGDLAAHTAAAAVQENVVPATCGADGSYDSVVYCSVCGYEISRTTGNVISATAAHTWGEWSSDEDGHSRTCSVCEAVDEGEHDGNPCSVCGYEVEATEPVQDDALVIQGASVGFDPSSLKVTFRIRKTVFALYDEVKLAITAEKYDTATYNETDPVVLSLGEAQMTSQGSYYTYVYNDIQLYELGLNFTYQLQGYDGEGNLVAYSAETTTSIADQLKELAEANSDNADLVRMIDDILVVGDTAVSYFATEGSDAANATSIIAGYDISGASTSVGTLNTVNDFVAYNDAFGTGSSDTYRVQTSAGIGKVPYITLRIRNAASLLDRMDVTVSYGGNEIEGEFAVAGNFLTYTLDSVSLVDSNADITFNVTLDGSAAFALTYSVETYYSTNIAGGTAAAGITSALAKLGASARAYFA